MRRFIADWIWFLCFIALGAAFVAGFHYGSDQIPPEKQQERTQAAKGGPKVGPSSVPQLHAEQGSPETTKEEKPHGNSILGLIGSFFEVKLTDLVIAIFTVVLAIKTSGLFRETAGLREATDRLWEAGERQLKLLAASSARQSGDMQDSITAANEANEISRTNLHAAQRPWVSAIAVTPIEIDFRDGIKITFEIEIRNSGQTPATNVGFSYAGWCRFLGGSAQEAQASIIESLTKYREDREARNYGYLLVPGVPFKKIHRFVGGWSEPDPNSVDFHVVGGVDYRYPGAGTYHQTGFSFQLVRLNVDGLQGGFGIRSRIFKPGESFVPSEVEFRASDVGFFSN